MKIHPGFNHVGHCLHRGDRVAIWFRYLPLKGHTTTMAIGPEDKPLSVSGEPARLSEAPFWMGSMLNEHNAVVRDSRMACKVAYEPAG